MVQGICGYLWSSLKPVAHVKVYIRVDCLLFGAVKTRLSSHHVKHVQEINESTEKSTT